MQRATHWLGNTTGQLKVMRNVGLYLERVVNEKIAKEIADKNEEVNRRPKGQTRAHFMAFSVLAGKEIEACTDKSDKTPFRGDRFTDNAPV